MVNASQKKLVEDHQMIEHYVDLMKEKLFSVDEGVIKIDVMQLLKQKNHTTLLFYLLKDFGFHRDVTDSIFEAAVNNKTGNLFSSKEYQALLDRDFLILKKARSNIEDKLFHIHSTDQLINGPVSLKFEIVDYTEQENIIKEPSVAYFDRDKIQYPLKIRKWKHGDRFIPFGMEGSKLISDFLVDKKVNRFEKENIYVLESGEEIAWVIGYRISELFKVSTKTKKILKASFESML